MKPRLHLVGIFHTQHTQEYSHCAFTGKALRFPKMLQMYGYKVIEYSNEGSHSTADEHVPILSFQEFDALYGSRKSTDFHGNDATIGSAGHTAFESRLIDKLRERIQPQDIICHPFGHAHQRLMEEFPNNQHVETGIGYPTLMPYSFRIFESYAWMHYHQGKENRNGRNYEWVVPNYYDLDDWDPSYEPGQYYAFLGRITTLKGMDTLRAMADYLRYPIVLHGQGDASEWAHPNIEYKGPLTGRARSNFLGGAKALLAPTVFTEPFCGMAVEAMLCGTPVIAVDYGAMTETVQPDMGFRCHTLQDWLEATDAVDDLDRRFIADTARTKYSLQACGAKYNKIFRQLNDLYRKGWYEVSYFNYTKINAEEGPFAARLAEWIKDNIDPANCLDLGCGPGTYVQALRNFGINAVGIDIDPRVEGEPYLSRQSLFETWMTGDLVLCLEVAEHIENELSADVAKAVADSVNDGGMLIWSAAHPGQGGVGHINCQTKEFWQELLEGNKLTRDEKLESQMIEYIANGYHMGWFLQNAMIFKK
jgi:glycosyltransferase involved in cell wall biosynthesis/SAM-dependent methyltransferase